MNNIEFVSEDGFSFDLFINGIKQEQIYNLVIRAEVNNIIKIEIGRYGLSTKEVAGGE